MIVEVGGGKGGFKEYLENGIKAGRDFHRNELDQRVPLFGDLDVFEVATSLNEGEGRKYDHITLSFSERHVTNDMLQIAVNDFRNHALSAWPEEERHRVPFYAEAHRPKLQSYVNSETGEDVERFVHIHIGMGRHDLETGKAIEPLGYLGPGTDNIKFIDAWQEFFNSKHGFSSPKDNPKITPENAIDVIARYTGQVPDAFGTQNEKKAALEITLQREVISQSVTTWEAFGKLLSSHGEVSKINEGKFNESYRVKLPDAEKAMRLKGVFFQRQFIERPTTEKIRIISDKARAAYLEQMRPRKEPQYVAGVLEEWHQTKAKEFRYLNTGGRYYKNVYLPADAQTRIQILNDLERKNHGITRPSTATNRKITTTRNRVPGMPVRNLDGIQSRTEMLLPSDPGMDVRAEPVREQMGADVRQTNGRVEVGLNEENTVRLIQSLIQPSSVLARTRADMLDQYEQAAEKEKYAEIRENIDCLQLLSRLSHTHGLNPILYEVTTAKDGTPRIRCGSRSLSPSDFLMKELGLPWKEAAPILRQTYEHQLGKRVTTVRENAAPAALRREFKADQLAAKPAIAQLQQEFDAETKRLRASLIARLKSEQSTALAGLTGARKKATQSLSKLSSATAKAEFDDERRGLRKAIEPTQAQAWRVFLQTRAQAGSGEALATLRRLDDTARATPAQSIGTIYLNHEDEKKRRLVIKSTSSLLKQLAHVVETNGDITYRQGGHAVLRDEGSRLAVLDPNSEEAIAAALLLGREKFGTDLTLTGPPEFQRRVVEVAVAQGIQIKFVDPQLEAMRLQLTKEKRQAAQLLRQEKVDQAPTATSQAVAQVKHQAEPSHSAEAMPPTQSNKSAKQVIKMPALVPEVITHAAELPPQLVPEVVPTAAQWMAMQHSLVDKPYSKNVGDTEYNVLYVAVDGVVVSHGRSIATYSIPTDIALQVGSRVVIDSNGALCLPRVPEPGKEKDKGIG